MTCCPGRAERFCVNCGISYQPPQSLCVMCNTDPVIPREMARYSVRGQRDGFVASFDMHRLIYPGEHASFSVAAVTTIAAFLVLSVASLGFFIALIVIGVLMQRVRQHSQKYAIPRVGDKNFPEIDTLVDLACYRLGMPRPDVYVQQDPTLNAYASGFLDGQWLVIHSETVEALEPKELLFVIGHELGHIRYGHTTLLNFIAHSGNHPIPVVTTALALIFKVWSRKAEYTADRAGLLACRNPDAAGKALLKLLIGPEGARKTSLREYMDEIKRRPDDKLTGIAECFYTHPFIPKRILAIQNFSRSNIYRQLASERGMP